MLPVQVRPLEPCARVSGRHLSFYLSSVGSNPTGRSFGDIVQMEGPQVVYLPIGVRVPVSSQRWRSSMGERLPY